MNYTVQVSRSAEKFLRALTDGKLYQRLRGAIDGLEENPRPSNSIKPQGEDELYRVRVEIIELFIRFRTKSWLFSLSKWDIVARFIASAF